MPAPTLTWAGSDAGRVLKVAWVARMGERLLALGGGGAYILEHRAVCGHGEAEWRRAYRGQLTYHHLSGLGDPDPEWVTEHQLRLAATHAVHLSGSYQISAPTY